jgi:hypothetical protein
MNKKGGYSPKTLREIYYTIQKQADKHSVCKRCSIYGIARNSYYKCLKPAGKLKQYVNTQKIGYPLTIRGWKIVPCRLKVYKSASGNANILNRAFHTDEPVQKEFPPYLSVRRDFSGYGDLSQSRPLRGSRKLR